MTIFRFQKKCLKAAKAFLVVYLMRAAVASVPKRMNKTMFYIHSSEEKTAITTKAGYSRLTTLDTEPGSHVLVSAGCLRGDFDKDFEHAEVPLYRGTTSWGKLYKFVRA